MTVPYVFGNTAPGQSIPLSRLDDNFDAVGNSANVSFIQNALGAVRRTSQSKMADFVSVKDFGAVGDGVTDDTSAIMAAIATGIDVYAPVGYTFAITGNVTGFANNQRIFGGGTFKKFGVTIMPMFLLPDMSEGVWFDGVEFDGSYASFSPGNAVPAILGYITHSLKVTNCYFHDIIDCGIKLRDGANLYAAGNTFYNIGENGIELHNYTVDVRTGLPYVGTRPIIEGNHTIIGNRFEKITRYENPLGPLVDACGVNFIGANGYPQKNVRVVNNVMIDCLRFIWTENNPPASLADGIVISGNTLEGGVNGGIAQNIYGKSGIGIVGAKNVVISSNTLKNIANHNPVGSETACIVVSGSSTTQNVDIFGNSCVDDSGLADRTEWGIYCLAGTNIRIHDNYVDGVQNGAGIYVDGGVVSPVIYANRNTESAYSWYQIIPLVFGLSNISAGATANAYPYNMTAFDSSMVLPSKGRIVGVSARLSTLVTAGTITVKVFGNAVEMTNLRIVTADFSGTTNATKSVGSAINPSIDITQPYSVTIETNAGFLPTTNDITVTVFVDIGLK